MNLTPFSMIGNDNTDPEAMSFLAQNRHEFEWGTAFVADDAARGSPTMFSAELSADPAAFQHMYNALLFGGVDKQLLQQTYKPELMAFADSGTDSVARGIVGGYGAMAVIGATLALAPGAAVACAKNPVVCSQVLADMAMGDAIGGASLTVPVAVGAGTAAHVADEIVDATRAAAKVEQEAAALARIGQNPVGPELVEKVEGSVLAEQQSRNFDALSNLFNKSSSANEISVAGQTITAVPVGPGGSNVAGTTKVFDSQNLTDQQIMGYAQQLAGNVPLRQVAPGVYTAKLVDGTTINLRSVSSSQQTTGARWTIDVKGSSQVNQAAGLPSDKRVEIKFR